MKLSKGEAFSIRSLSFGVRDVAEKMANGKAVDSPDLALRIQTFLCALVLLLLAVYFQENVCAKGKQVAPN
jgi:hypothetical protein